VSKNVHPILLVRHARAEESHPLGDAARGLDSKGRLAFRKHARKLAEDTRLVGIATSPLVRAVQTAEILADAFGLPEVMIDRALVPGARSEGAEATRILQLARELGEGWALVGHNPGFSAAAAKALGRPAPIRVRKGAAVALIPDGDNWKFAWLAAPGRPVIASDKDLD
jgi:phosphohistidine phosphatase